MSNSELQILQEARTATGLEDFGEETFRAGLRVLLDDLDQPGIPGEVSERMRGVALSNLVQRLRLQAIRTANPAIADERIERPIFVIGLPRTGTSALVDMLAQDPDARSPLQWEVAHLCDLRDRAAWATDPRIDEFEQALRHAPAEFVELGLHTFGARLPDECNSFMALNFYSPNISVGHHLPRYNEWLRLSRMQRPYATHRHILQHLQHFGRGGRWTLKSPFHVFDLPGLLETYPDALFIQTHRDPMHMIPSNCGLYCTIRGQKAGHPNRNETAREVVDLWGTGLQRLLAARRDPAIDERIIDLSHRQMVTDPLGTVHHVYERIGLPFTAKVEEIMRRWVDAPAQHMSSVKFTLDEFGLQSSEVEAAFGSYRQRFGHFF